MKCGTHPTFGDPETLGSLGTSFGQYDFWDSLRGQRENSIRVAVPQLQQQLSR